MPDTTREEELVRNLDDEAQQHVQEISASLKAATGEAHHTRPPFETHPLEAGEGIVVPIEPNDSVLREQVELHKGRGVRPSAQFLETTKERIGKQNPGAQVIEK